MKTFKNLLSTISVIIIIIIQIILIVIFTTEHKIQKDNIMKVMEQVDLTSILNDKNLLISTNPNVENGSKIINNIYNITDSANLKRETVDAFINTPAIKDVTSTYLSNVANYLINGTENTITSEYLVATVKNNIDAVAATSNNSIDANAKELIVQTVSNNASKIVSYIPSPKEVVSKLDIKQLKMLNRLYSLDTKVILGSIVIGLTLFLMLVRHSFYKWLIWSGAANQLTGLLTIVMAFTFKNIISLFISNIDPVMLNSLFSDLKILLIIVGGVILLIGIIEVSIYSYIKKHKNEQMVADALDKIKEQYSKD